MGNNATKVDKLPTIRRLPMYLRILRDLAEKGREHVSSGELAEVMNMDSILVRKDLVLTGIVGTPRIGYHIPDLISFIEGFLGWGEPLDVFLIGAGHLGTAILGYREMHDNSHKIVAAFDKDPMKVGDLIHGVRVFDIAEVPELVKKWNVRLAILTVHAEDAQGVADFLVDAGIKGIWNFTSASLDLPDDIMTHTEDLLSGLAVLSVKMARRE
jgi:redox-sensing transcriptional repressor